MKDQDYNWFHENESIKSFLVYSSNIEYSDCGISIVIPTYKRGELLFRTIDSVVKQKKYGINYEIVIVDNENENKHIFETIDKLKTYSVNIKYYVNEKNIGLYGNWNMCFRNASASIVAMLHDDDILFDNYFFKIKKIMVMLKTKKWGYIKTRNCFFKDETRIQLPTPQGPLGLKKFTVLDTILSLGAGTIGSPTCGSLFNRDAVISLGGFNPIFYPSADVYFPIKIILKGYKVYITTEALGGYRLAVNVSGKIETMIKTIEMDKKLTEHIGNISRFAKLYTYFFTNAKLEKERKYYKIQISCIEFKKYPQLSIPVSNMFSVYLFDIINVVRKIYRVLFAIRM